MGERYPTRVEDGAWAHRVIYSHLSQPLLCRQLHLAQPRWRQPLGRIWLGEGVKECRYSVAKPCAECGVRCVQAPRPCTGRALSRQF